MAEDPAARRARLRALREAAAEEGEGGGAGGAPAPAPAPPAEAPPPAAGSASVPVLKFRNYNPADKGIEATLAPAQPPPDFAPPPPASDPLAAALGGDDDALLAAVAPKKPTADLKRDLEGKLAKLDRRTQRAMVEMMRDAEERGVAVGE